MRTTFSLNKLFLRCFIIANSLMIQRTVLFVSFTHKIVRRLPRACTLDALNLKAFDRLVKLFSLNILKNILSSLLCIVYFGCKLYWWSSSFWLVSIWSSNLSIVTNKFLCWASTIPFKQTQIFNFYKPKSFFYGSLTWTILSKLFKKMVSLQSNVYVRNFTGYLIAYSRTALKDLNAVIRDCARDLLSRRWL